MTGTWEYVDGEPWYVRPSGRTRARGRWITCEHCGERCPAQMRNPGKYCSRTCSALAREPWGDRAATRADLFSAWTPDECWLTGLIWADGCLTMSRGKPFVVLSMTDEQAVRDAAHVAGCRYHRRAQTPPRRDVFTMKFGAASAVAALVGLGLEPRKSLTAPWPTLPHPDAFLRGAFDGDGSVGWYVQGNQAKRRAGAPPRLHSSLCGSHAFLDGAQRFLAEKGIEPRKINTHGRVWRLQWNHRDSLTLRDVLYSDGGPCLERKREQFFKHP